MSVHKKQVLNSKQQNEKQFTMKSSLDNRCYLPPVFKIRFYQNTAPPTWTP
jgi:hypothetical protein